MVGAGDLHRGGPVGVDDRHLLVLQRLVVVDRTDLETLRIEGSGFLHPVLLEELVAFFLQLQGSLEIGLVGAAGLHLELGVVVPPESELVEAGISQCFFKYVRHNEKLFQPTLLQYFRERSGSPSTEELHDKQLDTSFAASPWH